MIVRSARLATAAIAGYLLGTIPSADAAARLATAGALDLREAGSGNPGAANALSLLGARWGYTVMAADIAKGGLACRLGRRIAGAGGEHLAGPAAVVGHCYPAWNGFRGGKGVGTSAGQCLATFPAYFPLDLAVAAATATAAKRGRRDRAFAGTAAASAIWVAATVLWWRRRWPNGWGASPGPALTVATAASSAVIIKRFRDGARS